MKTLPIPFKLLSLTLLLGAAHPLARAASPASSAAPANPKMLYDLGQGSGAVTFDAIGKPSAIKIHAKGDAAKGLLTVVDGKVTGTATFKLDSLDTGIGMRNDHMKKHYLETDKFPDAKLTITELTLPTNYSAADFSADKLPFKGTLSLHGVDKPVTGTVKLTRAGSDLSFEAHFGLKIEDFSISVPTFAGITMASDVNCEVDAKAPFVAK